MKPVDYVCTSSSRRIIGQLDENTAWFDLRQVAYLFGVNLEKATKFLRQADTTGDIAAVIDVRVLNRCNCLLSHRAVLSVGYHLDYGRTTAFRRWCATGLGGGAFWARAPD
jgi:hypothetical protein